VGRIESTHPQAPIGVGHRLPRVRLMIVGTIQ
jgi:hypothetical protein